MQRSLRHGRYSFAPPLEIDQSPELIIDPQGVAEAATLALKNGPFDADAAKHRFAFLDSPMYPKARSSGPQVVMEFQDSSEINHDFDYDPPQQQPATPPQNPEHVQPPEPVQPPQPPQPAKVVESSPETLKSVVHDSTLMQASVINSPMKEAAAPAGQPEMKQSTLQKITTSGTSDEVDGFPLEKKSSFQHNEKNIFALDESDPTDDAEQPPAEPQHPAPQELFCSPPEELYLNLRPGAEEVSQAKKIKYNGSFEHIQPLTKLCLEEKHEAARRSSDVDDGHEGSSCLSLESDFAAGPLKEMPLSPPEKKPQLAHAAKQRLSSDIHPFEYPDFPSPMQMLPTPETRPPMPQVMPGKPRSVMFVQDLTEQSAIPRQKSFISCSAAQPRRCDVLSAFLDSAAERPLKSTQILQKKLRTSSSRPRVQVSLATTGSQRQTKEPEHPQAQNVQHAAPVLKIDLRRPGRRVQ